MSTQKLTDEVKTHFGFSIFMGALITALGLWMVAYPLATAAITTVFLGWTLIFVGLAQFVFAFHSKTLGKFLLKILSSLLFVIFGIALAFFPIAGVAVLTGMLGTLLLVQAALLAVTALEMKPLDGWGWYLADAATTLLLGILILARWPFSSVWAIGTLVGVSVLISGVSRIMLATKIRRGVVKVQRLVGAE